MTKEELKQKAEEKAKQRTKGFKCQENCEKSYVMGALDFAEPGENRIKELEKRNAELEEQITLMQDAKCSSCTTLGGMQLKIDKLKDENAELETTNKSLLESCEGATMLYRDLCKATEIIKKYLSIGVGGKITQNYLDVTKEAEQFLEDVKE